MGDWYNCEVCNDKPILRCTIDMLCPECMGVLVVSDGKRAKCPLHGGQYEVLFSRLHYKQKVIVGAGFKRTDESGQGGAGPGLPDKVAIQCPHCGQKYKIPAKQVGREVLCKKCNSSFRLAVMGQTGESVVTSTDAATEQLQLDATSKPTLCVRHPNVRAAHFCPHCGAPMCGTCEFPQADGTYVCPDCVTKTNEPTRAVNIEEVKKLWRDEADKGVLKAATVDASEYSPQVSRIIREEAVSRGLIQQDAMTPEPSPAHVVVGQAGISAEQPPPATIGQFCVRHSTIQAVQVCKVCSAAMCQTCDFVFPGNIHLCPTCATSPDKGPKGKRRTYLIWSYILAGWSTLASVFFLSGVAAEGMGSEADAEVLGIAMTFLLLVPALIGLALGCSAMERQSKPVSVWVATIWNGIIVGLFILLCIVGIAIG